MNATFKKSFAEFLGTAVFLTAIAGSVSSGSPLKQLSLALTLGLMILLLGGVSGAHFNPVVSLYFYSRKEISLRELLSYIGSQLLGALAGAALGLALWGNTITAISNTNVASAPLVIGEVVATAGLVLLIGHLASNKQAHLIWVAVAAWVFAAGTFTGTGAQANPAVSFGLLFTGAGIGTISTFVLAQVVGLALAIGLQMVLGAKVKKAAKAKK
ncbi:MAG: hypothetical protein RIR16_148 [Actinomycetota bacterium]|jgi:glycerol uptake facilitator-like aquaporin